MAACGPGWLVSGLLLVAKWAPADYYQFVERSPSPPPALVNSGAGPGRREFYFIMQELLRKPTRFCFLQVSKQG